MADTLLHPTRTGAPERLAAMGPDRRLAAYEDGLLSVAEMHV